MNPGGPLVTIDYKLVCSGSHATQLNALNFATEDIVDFECDIGKMRQCDRQRCCGIKGVGERERRNQKE